MYQYKNNSQKQTYLAESMFHCRTTVHERLSNDRETRIDYVGLVDVKHKLWVLDDVHPESQRKTVDSKKYICQFLNI